MSDVELADRLAHIEQLLTTQAARDTERATRDERLLKLLAVGLGKRLAQVEKKTFAWLI